MEIQKYSTNLTEQQYKSNFGRLESYSNILRNKLKSEEITTKEYVDTIFEFANKLQILTTTDSELISETNPKGLKIVSPHEIFTQEEKPLPFHKRFQEEKNIDIITPKQFVTVGERNAPCKILERQNVKELMISTVEYADRVRRETKYELCETPKGVRVSSPTFGQWGAVSTRSERTSNKCSHEFGENSRKIGEFHTHPGTDSGSQAFSMADLLSFKDDALNYDNSNCIVFKKIDKKGKETIGARCTSGVDAKRFINTVKFKTGEKLNFEDIRQNFETRFIRDPDSQNAFSCVVTLNKKSNSEVIPKKRIVPIKQIKQVQRPSKTQQKEEKREIIKKAKKEVKKNSNAFDFGSGFNL